MFHPLSVVEKRHDTEDSTVMTFDVPPELSELFEFEAGQHITLRTEHEGEEIRRSYSICTPVGSSIQIGVRRDPMGAMSRWLHDTVDIGDVVEAMSPIGSFCPSLDTDGTPQHHVAIAAGSGITPIMSILGSLLAANSQASATLLYVNRDQSSTMFIEDLEALKNRHIGRLRITHLFTRDPGPSDILSGRIDASRLGELVGSGVVPGSADAYFVCGPQPLKEVVIDGLLAADVDRERISFEVFGTPGKRAVTSSSAGGPTVTTASITLNGRSTTVPMAEGDTVLAAVLRQRPDAPYSCTVGACSTCRAHVSDGNVEMEVCYGLDDDEVASGYVLTCQARPMTDAITVDYDA